MPSALFCALREGSLPHACAGIPICEGGLADAKCEVCLILVHFFSLLFFLAPHKKEAKRLSGSTYGFEVRFCSYVPQRQKLALYVPSNSLTQSVPLRRVAYFASASLMNPNSLRTKTMKKRENDYSLPFTLNQIHFY